MSGSENFGRSGSAIRNLSIRLAFWCGDAGGVVFEGGGWAAFGLSFALRGIVKLGFWMPFMRVFILPAWLFSFCWMFTLGAVESVRLGWNSLFEFTLRKEI